MTRPAHATRYARYRPDASRLLDDRELPYIDASGSTAQGTTCAALGSHYVIADLDRRMRVRQSSVPTSSQPAWRASAQGLLALVADGVPGDATIAAMARHVTGCVPWLAPRVAQGEHGRVLDALARALPDGLGPGAMTIAYTAWPALYLVSTGRSVALLLRRGELLTLSGRGARARAHLACRAADHRDVHGRHIRLEEGDSVLVCSRRLADHVSAAEIARVLGSDQVAATACERLLQAAADHGAVHPLTAVVCRVGCVCTPWRAAP